MAYSYTGQWPTWITPALKTNYEQFGNSAGSGASDQSSYDALITKMLGDQEAYDKTPAAAADPAYAQQAQVSAEAAARGLTVDQWMPVRQDTINAEGEQSYNDYMNHLKHSGTNFTLGMIGAAIGGAALAGGFAGGGAVAGGGAEAATTSAYAAPGASITGSELGLGVPAAVAAPITASQVAPSLAAGGGAPAATAAETASGFPSSAVSAGPDPDMLKGGALGPASTTFDSVTSFLKDNKDLVGAVLAGLGKGIISGNEVAAKAQADQDLLKLRYNLTAANYRGANPNNTYRGLAQPTGNPSPTEKFTVKPLDMSSFGGYEWIYDRAQGRIVRTPITPPRAQSG